MYYHSPTSKSRLSTCHRDLQLIFETLIQEADHTIVCGHRSEADQTEAYINGHSKVMFPHSKHNKIPSKAVDVAPYNDGIDWNDYKAFAVLAGRVLSISDRLYRENKISHKIRWGGDWDSDGSTVDQRFNDLPHFELVTP